MHLLVEKRHERVAKQQLSSSYNTTTSSTIHTNSKDAHTSVDPSYHVSPKLSTSITPLRLSSTLLSSSSPSWSSHSDRTQAFISSNGGNSKSKVGDKSASPKSSVEVPSEVNLDLM